MRAFGNDVSEWCDSRDRAEMTSRPGPKYVPYPPFGSETNIVPKIPGPCWGPSNATGHRVQPSMVVSHRGFWPHSIGAAISNGRLACGHGWGCCTS